MSVAPEAPGGAGSAVERAGRGVTRMLFDGLLLVVSLAILIGWAWQGVFNLAPGESAVILRLGAYHRTRSLEGLWLHWPPPLESHVVVNTSAVRIESFGENPTRSTPGVPGDREEGRVAEGIRRAAIQTSDHNVVQLAYQLQYRIADAYAFSFSMSDPDSVLHDATEAAMRDVIGRRTIDDVMSQRRDDIQREAAGLLAEMLDGYARAVGQQPAFAVAQINLEKSHPPDEVREAFVDVVSAGQDEKRATMAAKGDAAEIVERARSQAAEIREQAEAYRAAKIVEAQGEAARFEALLAQYRVAPEVTRRRLYLETMETILPGMEKAIVERGAVNLWSSWPPARAAEAPPVGAPGVAGSGVQAAGPAPGAKGPENAAGAPEPAEGGPSR